MIEEIVNQKAIKKQVEEIVNFFDSNEIEEIGRLSGFVKRNSKLDSKSFFGAFILGVSMFESPTLQEFIGILNIIKTEIKITREGFQQRINNASVNFFKLMLEKALENKFTGKELDILKDFGKVHILDSTTIELHNKLSNIFKGFGGKGSKSAIKIQFFYDFKTGSLEYKIQAGATADNKYENSFIDKMEKNDLIIKDLGYFSLQTFIDIANKGVFYLSRWKSDANMYKMDELGKLVVFDIEKHVSSVDEIQEIEIYIKKDKNYTKTRLVIEKVPEEIVNKRLRKINKNSKRHGAQVKERTKLFQKYNFYISNIPKDKLSKEYFRVFYTIRWQIELMFKNWKTNFNIEKISGMKLERAMCMIYSRLILIFLSIKIIFQIRSVAWLEKKVEISEFKASKHLLIVFTEIIKLVIKKQSSKIYSLLIAQIDFIVKNCKKIKQKSRSYPFAIIESMGLA